MTSARSGREDGRGREAPLEARALELTAGGASWLAALAQARDEQDAGDGAGAPGRRTLTARLAPRLAAASVEARAGGAGASAPGPAIARDALGGDVDLAAALPDVRALAGGGAPLPRSLRTQLAAALGFDLDAVRIHTDATADRAARALDARAFAVGPDIGFKAGAFDPSTPAGLHLLAHEVAHTTQAAAPGPPRVSQPGDPGERAADAFADGFVSGQAPDRDLVGSPTPGDQAPLVRRAPAGEGGSVKARVYLAAAGLVRDGKERLLAFARAQAARLPPAAQPIARALVDTCAAALDLVVQLAFAIAGLAVGASEALVGVLQGLVGLIGWLGKAWYAFWSAPFDGGEARVRLYRQTLASIERLVLALGPAVDAWRAAYGAAPLEVQTAMIAELSGQLVVLIGTAGAGGAAGTAAGSAMGGSLALAGGGTMATASAAVATSVELAVAVAGLHGVLAMSTPDDSGTTRDPKDARDAKDPKDPRDPKDPKDPTPRQDRLAALSTEGGRSSAKTRAEAEAILQAEQEGKVVGVARRTIPTPDREPPLDFRMIGPDGKPLGYVDVKTPRPTPHRSVSAQAQDVAGHVRAYDADVQVVIDLKHLPPVDKELFVRELASQGVVESGRIHFLNR